MGKRIHNFNAGPAALPLPVLEEIRDEFLNYKGSGMSVTELSHRSKWFDDIINETVERTKRLLKLGEDYHVLFIQGGASLQFCMIPMNLAVQGKPVDYINTGTWSTKAIKEAEIQGKDVRVIASSEDTSPFGLIYAGAQKNIGPSGTALVIVRRDMLDRAPDGLPTMLRYTTYAEKNSMFNTPSCFVIYTISLVLKWLEETIGGLDKMEQINEEKAGLLYDFIDKSDFYRGTAAKDSRSLMNVTFRLPSEELEAEFVAKALEAGLGGLKGHRSVGGCRASIYNATGMDGIKALVDFMIEFEKKEG
jgi:phosphoserine aminotransferase